MKVISGYAFVVTQKLGSDEVTRIFGASKSYSYENIVTSGLNLFQDLLSAKIALEIFKKNDLPKTEKSNLLLMELQIPENQADEEVLKNSNSLLVLLYADTERILIGGYQDGQKEPLPEYPQRGAQITNNGLTVISSYPEAREIACDRGRQGGMSKSIVIGGVMEIITG